MQAYKFARLQNENGRYLLKDRDEDVDRILAEVDEVVEVDNFDQISNTELEWRIR